MKDGNTSNKDPGTEPQPKPETTPMAQNVSMPSQGAGWVRIAPSQVMRTVAIALLTAAVVLGALFLIWQLRTFVSWFVAALFLAAVLNPLVNWFQQRHRLIKRPLAIGLTYVGLLVALLLIVGIFLPVIVDQINSLIKFIGGVQNAPGGPQDSIKGLFHHN